MVTERDVLLVYLPVGLNWGYITLMQTIMAGARAVLMERFSARGALEAIERERITYIPTRACRDRLRALAEPELDRFDLSSLRVVITGGASAAIETIRAYQARAKGHLIELYGMLETGFHTYHAPHRQSARTVKRHHRPLLVERYGNPHDRRVPATTWPYGEIGEVAARGPIGSPRLSQQRSRQRRLSFTRTMAGFAPATSAALPMPIAVMSQHRPGASKEIIKRGGKKFFPREVEEIPLRPIPM